jgi:hypothetical protein
MNPHVQQTYPNKKILKTNPNEEMRTWIEQGIFKEETQMTSKHIKCSTSLLKNANQTYIH